MRKKWKDKDLLSELELALKYFPKTGQFKWQVWRQSHARIINPGTVAGTITPDGRVQIGFTDSKGKKWILRAHRLAFWFMTGEVPEEIDHKDGNPSNNKWSNLREVTHSENNQNIHKVRSDNISGKRGVSWAERPGRRGKWLARITVDGEFHELGCYVTKEEAIAARRAAELKYLGSYSPS